MPNRPNLVFIFSDRQRYDTMRCYGNDWIKTPHLNALSEQSFVFEHAYVTQAVCAPARSSIITGLYPHSSGVPRNRLVMRADAPTIAELVSPEYRTAYYGKWHLGNEVVRQHGFDEWVSVMDSLWESYTRDEYHSRFSDYHHFLAAHGREPDEDAPGGRIFSNDSRAGLPAELQMASFLADRAVDFIEAKRHRPFILYVSFIEPHPPWAGPYDGMYDPASLPVEPTFLKRPEGGPTFNRIRADLFAQSEADGHDLSTEAGWRSLRASYLANVTLVDDAVGKIVGAVDSAGLAANTAVVFTSEHGDMVGTHGLLEMRTFYEEAARAPLLMRIPWLSPGHRAVEGNFGQIDLLPTLLELLGEPTPSHLQGTSRAGVLRGEATLAGNAVFMEHNGVGDRDLSSEVTHTAPAELVEAINVMKTVPWRSVVTADRWKLNLCAGDRCELFDLNADPYEERNLFDEPRHRDRVRAMAARVRLWQRETGDDAPLPAV